MPQLFQLVEISLITPKNLLTWAPISFSGDLENVIQRRIYLASSAFGCLSRRVFGKQSFTIQTKIAVYDAVVISTILCDCETWVPYCRHIRLLESFHIRHLQLILGLCWWHKVTHCEIRSRSGIPSIESMPIHRLLRWLGHVIRMPHSSCYVIRITDN